MAEQFRILALETTGMSGTVAALLGDRLLAARELAAGRRSAQSLAPGIAELWWDVGWRAADVQLVAVTVGPGSFTGLRVGVTTAKTLAFAIGAAVLGIDTLEVIAAQTPPPVDDVWTTFDAQRGEVIARRWRRIGPDDPLSWQVTNEAAISNGAAWAAERSAGEVVCGPPLKRWREHLPANVVVAAEQSWQPQAATVGRLAWRKYQAGQRHDLWALAPVYMRPSAAEEKLAAGKVGGGSSDA